MRKKILAFGDMHAGSFYGLLPPDFIDVRGNPHEQAPGQRYLWSCWTEMLGSIPPGSMDMVAVVGDTIDGKQPKSSSEPLTLHRLEDQVGPPEWCWREYGAGSRRRSGSLSRARDTTRRRT